MRRWCRRSKRPDHGVSTHVTALETAIEVEMSLEERGMRHVPSLRWLPAPDVQLAHAVWLDDDELDALPPQMRLSYTARYRICTLLPGWPASLR